MTKLEVSSRIRKFLRFWLPVVMWAAIIFVFSSRPTARTSEIHWQDFVVKKTAHIILFGVLCLLLYRALRQEGIEKKNSGLYAVVITFMYAVSDELHQSFTPGREPTFRDIIFDTIGALSAIYLIWNTLPKLPLRLKKLAKDFQLL